LIIDITQAVTYFKIELNGSVIKSFDASHRVRDRKEITEPLLTAPCQETVRASRVAHKE
jgi:hypothetical protein